MKISGQRQRVRVVAGAVTVVLTAALLSSVTQASANGADEFGAGVRLDRQEETDKVGFIGTRAGQPIDSGFGADAAPGTVARAFLTAHADTLGLRGSSLRVVEKHATARGGTAVRLGQSFSGVPVLGGEFVVNLDAGNDVLSVLGEASPITKTSTTPAVSAASAERTAVASVAKDVDVKPADLAASTPELMLYDPRLLGAPGPFQSARLAWVTEVRGTGRVTDIGHQVIVDAVSGTVALSFETIAHAKNRIVCDANNTSAQYPCVAPVWTEGVTPGGVDGDVPPAYNYAGDTYDFFFTRFSRDSLDDAGMQLVSTVDFCPGAPDPCPYPNAFWDGAQMVYGDGFAAADDVVGHELTHGVTEFSSHLFYYQQSGAINESMSDVFGEYIDLVNGAGNDTAGVRWLLGEDIPGIPGGIRNMANPPAFGDPDRMLSPLYYADPNETDGGGVHFNSGVNNKAAFLMVDGGSFNGQTITGLGITKAARIYYTVNNSMLVSGSDYADLANALRQACTSLIGTDGITAGDCVEVNEITLATEMDQNPTNAPTRTAAFCPTGDPLSTVLSDDLETNTGQLTTGAAVGTSRWYYPQVPNPYSFDATYATSGTKNVWGYDQPGTSDTFIRMTNAVAIPANAYLHFNHAFGFDDDSGGAYDGGVLEYSTAGAGGPWSDAASLLTAPGGANGYTGTISTGFSNPLQGRSAFVRESNGYGSSRASLASLAGQNVMFRWRMGTDSFLQADDYGWFLDDLRISTCADVTPPDTTITSGPVNGSTITTPTATFGFTSSEAGSTFQCKLDGGPYAACLSPLSVGPLSEGAHTFLVVATDAAGNPDPSPATRSFTVDTTPPNTTITSGPANGSTITAPTATFGFTSSEAGSTFQCKVDGAAYSPCSSPVTTAPLANGVHTFTVVATDGAGNADPSPATRTFTVDTKPPQTTIKKHPSKVTDSHKARFVFKSSEPGSTFKCKLDKRKWKSCTSPKVYKNLKAGKHKFRVYAIDAAGNVDPTPAVWRWRIKP